MKMDTKFEEDMEMEDVMHHGKSKRLMTMEDVSEELKKDFTEEIADSKKYLCMSKIAENANCEETCCYLLEMAKDEYTHAYFIHDFMCEHDMHIPEEDKREFEKLKEKMKEFF